MSGIEGKETGAPRALLALALRYKYVLLMAAVGILLLLLPTAPGQKGQDVSADASLSDYSPERIQTQLEQMLEEMEDVGQARVMLTVASGSRAVYQNDRQTSYDGEASDAKNYSSVSETVLLSRSGSGQEALKTQEIYPDYVGALVVCDGADSASVVLQVKEAVSVLTGLGADCISVVKRNES